MIVVNKTQQAFKNLEKYLFIMNVIFLKNNDLFLDGTS